MLPSSQSNAVSAIHEPHQGTSLDAIGHRHGSVAQDVPAMLAPSTSFSALSSNGFSLTVQSDSSSIPAATNAANVQAVVQSSAIQVGANGVDHIRLEEGMNGHSVKLINSNETQIVNTGSESDENDNGLTTMKHSKSNYNRILLFFCLLTWGGGFFVVQIPGALGYGADDDWIVTGFSISVGRLLGTIVTLQFSTTQGFIKTVTSGLPRSAISLKSILYLFSPLVGSFGYVLYDMLLLEGGDVSVLSAATSLHVAVPIMFGILVLKEKINLQKGIGMALAVISVLLLSFSGGVSDDDGSGDDSGSTGPGGISATAAFLLLGIIATWGYSLVVSSVAGKVLSWDHMMMILFLGYVLYFAMIIFELLITAQFPKVWTWVILVKIVGHLIASFGFVLYVKLTSENDTAQWAALTSLYTVIPIILGIIAFGDEVNAFSGSGIALSLVAVWLLS